MFSKVQLNYVDGMFRKILDPNKVFKRNQNNNVQRHLGAETDDEMSEAEIQHENIDKEFEAFSERYFKDFEGAGGVDQARADAEHRRPQQRRSGEDDGGGGGGERHAGGDARQFAVSGAVFILKEGNVKKNKFQ